MVVPKEPSKGNGAGCELSYSVHRDPSRLPNQQPPLMPYAQTLHTPLPNLELH